MSDFGGRSSGNNYEFIRLNAKAIAFNLREKVNGQYNVTETFDFVRGKLVNAELDSYDYKGATKRKVKLEMESDSGSKALVEFNLNGASINLLNTLAVPKMDGLPEASKKLIKSTEKKSPFGHDLYIRAYPHEYNGETYCSLYIEIDGQKTEWAFDARVMAMLRKDLAEADGEAVVRFFNAHIKPWADDYNLTRTPDNDADNFFPAEDSPYSNEPEKEEVVEDDLPF